MNAEHGENGEPIVIVSGLPRSGTSMMMQMLERGGIPALTDGVRTADEDNPRGYYEFEPVKKTKQDPSWLDEAVGKVVKMVYLLLYDLPTDRKYRVILMRREMDEVLRSQAAMLARSGHTGSTLPTEKLSTLFADQLSQVVRYVHAQDCFEVLEVSYNALVEEPSVHAESLDEFLGGRLDRDAMLSAIDTKLYRQKL